jgi:hypothetical protein
MCTVTVVPHADGVRLVSNRDEQRTRASALPPALHEAGRHQAVFPLDPQGGGTWVGCNSAGLAAALLNVNGTGAPAIHEPRRSRGLIVRALLRCSALRDAVGMTAAIQPGVYAPFRVVLVQGRTVASVVHDGTRVVSRRIEHLRSPRMFTSSALGDALVAPPRHRLFDQVVLGAADGWLAGQSRFHDHQWPGRTAISVRMERTDALTVSRTTVDLTKDGCDLQYEAPLRPGNG